MASQVMLEADSVEEAAEFKAMFCDTDVVGLIMKLKVTMQRRESTEFSRVKKVVICAISGGVRSDGSISRLTLCS
jgi:hypothetical protein